MATSIMVKVGGSLFDLPDLGTRLRAWLDSQATQRVLLISGGGPVVDLVRQADAFEPIGEDRCHWIALRALSFTTHLLAARLPRGLVIEDIAERHYAWQCGQTPVLDAHAFAIADETMPDHLPHRWAVTSDSLAARIALVAGIPDLVLLKSCELPGNADWATMAERGIIDAALPDILAGAGERLAMKLINFRQWQPADASAIPPPYRGP